LIAIRKVPGPYQVYSSFNCGNKT